MDNPNPAANQTPIPDQPKPTPPESKVPSSLPETPPAENPPPSPLPVEPPSEPSPSNPLQPKPTPSSPPVSPPSTPPTPPSPPSPQVQTVTQVPGESASQVQERIIKDEQVKEVKSIRRSYKIENAVGVLFGAVEASLALRLVFKLFGAAPTNAFINFLYQFTGVFASPFEGIFGTNPMFGSFELDLASIIGMIIFAIIGFGALRLTKLF